MVASDRLDMYARILGATMRIFYERQKLRMVLKIIEKCSSLNVRHCDCLRQRNSPWWPRENGPGARISWCYSNSIQRTTESHWRMLKRVSRRRMADTFVTMMDVSPSGITQTEYRLRYHEAAIDDSMTLITPLLCLNMLPHSGPFCPMSWIPGTSDGSRQCLKMKELTV